MRATKIKIKKRRVFSSPNLHRIPKFDRGRRRLRKGRGGDGGSWQQQRGRLLPADGSDAVGADAAGPDHHPHGVSSPHRLLSRRPWPPPIQRRNLYPSI